MPETKAAPAEAHNYRLATHPDSGEHGYEVGFWPAGADQSDPSQYKVLQRCYSQQEAAQIAAQLDAAPPPDHLPPEESGEGGARAHDDDDDDDQAHRRSRHRK